MNLRLSSSPFRLLKQKCLSAKQSTVVVANYSHAFDPSIALGFTIRTGIDPAKLMGLESQGMLLAASDEDGNLSLLTVMCM